VRGAVSKRWESQPALLACVSLPSVSEFAVIVLCIAEKRVDLMMILMMMILLMMILMMTILMMMICDIKVCETKFASQSFEVTV